MNWRQFSLFILLSFFILISYINFSSGLLSDAEQILINIGLASEPDSEASLLKVNLNTPTSGSDLNLGIEELIKNGKFNNGMSDWDYWGEVEHVVHNQEQYIQIGRENSSTLVQQNCIRQQFFAAESSVFLTFDVKQMGDSDLQGFDAASFIVLIDDKPVLITPSFSQDWQSQIIFLQDLESGEHDLQFCAGSSGDRNQSSWFFVDNIFTLAAAVKEASILEIKSFNPELLVSAEYIDSSGLITQQAAHSLNLSFNEAIENNLLQMSLLENNSAKILDKELKLFWFDQIPSKADSLSVLDVNENRLLLKFNNAQYPANTVFKVLLAESSQNLLEGNAVCEANQANSEIPKELLRPTCFSEDCLLQVDVSACSQHTWAAIQVCDPAYNCSEKSTPIRADVDQTVPAPTNSQTANAGIVINEIMFNPEGNDRGSGLAGEWVELLNLSDTVVDIGGWKLQDKAGNTIELDLESASELQLNSGDYFLVFISGPPILNNSGDELTLINNQDEIIDNVAYPGSSVEGKTYGRYPDGTETWLPLLPPTPLAVNSSS